MYVYIDCDYCYVLCRFGVDMTAYPTITKVADNCRQLDAFKKADAFNQPDTPEELRTQSS